MCATVPATWQLDRSPAEACCLGAVVPTTPAPRALAAAPGAHARRFPRVPSVAPQRRSVPGAMTTVALLATAATISALATQLALVVTAAPGAPRYSSRLGAGAGAQWEVDGNNCATIRTSLGVSDLSHVALCYEMRSAVSVRDPETGEESLVQPVGIAPMVVLDTESPATAVAAYCDEFSVSDRACVQLVEDAQARMDILLSGSIGELRQQGEIPDVTAIIDDEYLFSPLRQLMAPPRPDMITPALPPPAGWGGDERDCEAVRAAVGSSNVLACAPIVIGKFVADGPDAAVAPIVVLASDAPSDVEAVVRAYCERWRITETACSGLVTTIAARADAARTSIGGGTVLPSTVARALSRASTTGKIRELGVVASWRGGSEDCSRVVSALPDAVVDLCIPHASVGVAPLVVLDTDRPSSGAVAHCKQLGMEDGTAACDAVHHDVSSWYLDDSPAHAAHATAAHAGNAPRRDEAGSNAMLGAALGALGSVDSTAMAQGMRRKMNRDLENAAAAAATTLRGTLPPPDGWHGDNRDCIAVQAAIAPQAFAVCAPMIRPEGDPQTPIVVLFGEMAPHVVASYCRQHRIDLANCQMVKDILVAHQKRVEDEAGFDAQAMTMQQRGQVLALSNALEPVRYAAAESLTMPAANKVPAPVTGWSGGEMDCVHLHEYFAPTPMSTCVPIASDSDVDPLGLIPGPPMYKLVGEGTVEEAVDRYLQRMMIDEVQRPLVLAEAMSRLGRDFSREALERELAGAAAGAGASATAAAAAPGAAAPGGYLEGTKPGLSPVDMSRANVQSAAHDVPPPVGGWTGFDSDCDYAARVLEARLPRVTCSVCAPVDLDGEVALPPVLVTSLDTSLEDALAAYCMAYDLGYPGCVVLTASLARMEVEGAGPAAQAAAAAGVPSTPRAEPPTPPPSSSAAPDLQASAQHVVLTGLSTVGARGLVRAPPNGWNADGTDCLRVVHGLRAGEFPGKNFTDLEHCLPVGGPGATLPPVLIFNGENVVDTADAYCATHALRELECEKVRKEALEHAHRRMIKPDMRAVGPDSGPAAWAVSLAYQWSNVASRLALSVPGDPRPEFVFSNETGQPFKHVLSLAVEARDLAFAAMGEHRAAAVDAIVQHYVTTAYAVHNDNTFQPPPASVLPEGVSPGMARAYVGSVIMCADALRGIANSLLSQHQYRAAASINRRTERIEAEHGFASRFSRRKDDGFEFPFYSKHKLLHDVEQLEYLQAWLASDEAAQVEEVQSRALATAGDNGGLGSAEARAWALGPWHLSPTDETWEPWIAENDAPVRQMSQRQITDALTTYERVMRQAGAQPVQGDLGEWYWDSLDAATRRTAPAAWDADMLQLSGPAQQLLRDSRVLERASHTPAIPPLKGPVINPDLDLEALQDEYESVDPSIIVVDDFLSDEGLAAMRRWAHEARAYPVSKSGYEALYFGNGLDTDVYAQLAEELHEKLPRIFCDHRMRHGWIYKYDSRLGSGTTVHADDGAVNFNVWLTDDGACEDPTAAGLDVYPIKPPEDFSYSNFNNASLDDDSQLTHLLNQVKDDVIVVPHKPNRVALFDSSLFHGSGRRLKFRPDYTGRRINLTLIFGRMRASCADSRRTQDEALQHTRSKVADWAARGVEGLTEDVLAASPPLASM